MMRAMAELQVLERDAPLADVMAAYDADGGVIVRDLLSDDARRAIVDDLSAGLEDTAPGSKSGMDLWETFHGRNTVRFCGLAARSRAFVDHALLNPVFTAVTDELLLANGADYWLNTGQVMAIGPGEPAQYLHRDENNWPEAVAADREVTVSCLFALSDFTRENGATVVVAGSQRRPPGLVRGAETSPDEIAYAEMPAGSGLIYSGKVIHGAGGNTTENWRYGMHVSFVVGWLRPEEASPLAVDRDRAASLPERARELLGWGSYHSEGGGRTWLVDFEDAARLFD
ncbi:MAG TPA: mitomycin antibiotic biosynthesis protein [Acidimicrobiaceae bacterium]|jgi:ectoine hydroxylase-related dioxygenase (phytanoyl-CoA dioxygenase family)|nr:mitomycin antibiotic biosynthesis protein [Acidimicrobiaceae bacterium]|tara:strand:- start:385 stop:1239 length:855 start_codon:yes stop_codon:yes gene_type:complete